MQLKRMLLTHGSLLAASAMFAPAVVTAAATPAKKGFVQIAEGDFMSLIGVIESLVENTTLSATNKQPLVDTIASVKAGVTTTATTAVTSVVDPVLTEGEALIQPETLGSDVAGLIGVAGTAGGPVGELAADVVEPVADSIVSQLASKFETTFANHNKTLLAGIAEIMGKPAPSQAQ